MPVAGIASATRSAQRNAPPKPPARRIAGDDVNCAREVRRVSALAYAGERTNGPANVACVIGAVTPAPLPMGANSPWNTKLTFVLVPLTVQVPLSTAWTSVPVRR